jgi:pyridoxal 5-phosphate dependent beta-lyase
LGFSIALGEHVAAGPPSVRSALAQVGRVTRTALAAVPGWRVVESVDEPSAITTLAPAFGVDPAAVREWLITQRRIVTTYIGVERAPFALVGPLLRVSPHIDATTDDLELFIAALAEATAASRR